MWQQLQRIGQRAIWSWDGFVHVYRTEVVLMGGVFVLAMECMNTAVERVVDDISTETRVLARQAKDTASAAVALSGIGVGVAWAVILWNVWGRSGQFS